MSLRHRLTPKTRLLGAYSTRYWMYLLARSPSSSAGEDGKGQKDKRPSRTGASGPYPLSGWLWAVDSDRSQRPVMQDGCETSVPTGSCCTTPATPTACPHHAFVARTPCTFGRRAWLIDDMDHHHHHHVRGQFVNTSTCPDIPRSSAHVACATGISRMLPAWPHRLDGPAMQ